MKLRLSLSIIACGLILQALPAYACRYNVREVGFIDVGIEAYRLLVYLTKDTSPDRMAELKDALADELMDTNIRFELVTVGADANHPALEFLTSCKISSFPAAVVVSPDGQARPLRLPRVQTQNLASVRDAVCSTLEGVLHSPTQQQILEGAADNYGVVLLIEGPERQRNAAAREAVSAAINSINEQLEYLPKPIARPPMMVVLDQPSLAREEVLLWTLGLKAEDINQPCAAVFYGRGRWIGPLCRGDMLASDRLAELLAVVGADCECGLDHRVLQGTMLPARWDETLRQKVAASLGFDPESPMIKMEMVSIVRRGMGGFDYPGVPFGYEEIQVGADDGERMTEDSGQKPEDGYQRTEDRGPRAAPASILRHPSSVLAVSLGGMTVLVAAASVVILRRAKKA